MSIKYTKDTIENRNILKNKLGNPSLNINDADISYLMINTYNNK